MGPCFSDFYMPDAGLMIDLHSILIANQPFIRTGNNFQCSCCDFTVWDKGQYFECGVPLKIDFPSERRDVLADIETNQKCFVSISASTSLRSEGKMIFKGTPASKYIPSPHTVKSQQEH